MADYRNLKGLYIKYLTSDPSNLVEGDIWYNSTSQTLKVAPALISWAAGGNLNTARGIFTGAGSNTAAVVFGGNVSPKQQTEEYNGSSWTNGENMGTARYYFGGAGPQTAAIAFG